MSLLRLDLLSNEAIQDLSPSFDLLTATEHKDGKYRLRRYSMVELLAEPYMFKQLPTNTFMQTDEYNDFQGNVERKFDNIDECILNGKGMKELIYKFRMGNKLPIGTPIDIHQMRIITLYDETPVSPEGVHRDGYDFIAMIGIARDNIKGGHLLVYTEQDGDHFMSIPLNAGQMVTLDDTKLWHNASDIKTVDKTKNGYMDAFIVTAKIDKKDSVWI